LLYPSKIVKNSGHTNKTLFELHISPIIRELSTLLYQSTLRLPILVQMLFCRITPNFAPASRKKGNEEIKKHNRLLYQV